MNIPKRITTRERVWELDAMRGLLILCVLVIHLYYTVDAFCVNGYYNIDSYAYVNTTDPLHFWFDWGSDGKIYRAFLTPEFVSAWTHWGVIAFFAISGICCLFSRDNLHRGLIMLAAAFVFSGFTKLLAIWTQNPGQFIRFGVLHCYAYCHILYYFLFENRRSSTLLAAAAGVLLLGYYLRFHPIYLNTPLLYPFGIYESGAPSRDYWPIFPMLGWLLIGVVWGRHFYPERKTMFPDTPMKKWTRPLQYLGRHSGKIYLAHIFVYTAVFCGIGWAFGLL